MKKSAIILMMISFLMISMLMSACTISYAEEEVDPDILPEPVYEITRNSMNQLDEDKLIEEIVDYEERVEIPPLEEVGTVVQEEDPESNIPNLQDALLDQGSIDAAKTKAFGSAGLVIIFGLLVISVAPKIRASRNKKKS